MNVTKTFGHYVEKLTENDHKRGAQWLLKTGWKAQDFKYKVMPDKRLLPSQQYLAAMMMDVMLAPLKDPEHSAIVSVFTPTEILQEFGLHPYNAEGYSCYLAASEIGSMCIGQAQAEGISETLCSYHRMFIGAAQMGLLPKPKCIVYTNLTCDANLLTFRELANLFDVPCFGIDVPYSQTEENVDYVADQLKDLVTFLEKVTGKKISQEGLQERCDRAVRSLKIYRKYQKVRADKYMPTDLVSPLYEFMTNNVLLGSEEEERYVKMALKDAEKAPASKGKKIFFMHTLPYWMKSMHQDFWFNENAQIVGIDQSQPVSLNYDISDPFRAMAHRMVYNHMNGPATRRIEAGIRKARRAKADGVIWFNHWGCKHTMGAAQLAKKTFEAEGIPLLVLDGDGCDYAYGGEGQTATRVEAFLEMLD
ncbi:MAG: 2-hydroxyacyl-CoA dehydratase family protein [Lachnospiraceae bacterium]|nr:2-hydroxyacyl-CoA dehydratase family protein [Lachnospiraceae bacterium]